MSSTVITIKPSNKLKFIDIKEIWRYRELFWTFVERDIKVRYKQTFLGIAWAIFQPLITMVIFSIFFGVVVNISSDGVPYPIFSYSGLILWYYFSTSLSSASSSLINNSSLITKVYFPRTIIPLSATLTGILDYGIALLVLGGMYFYFGINIPATVVFVPLILFVTWVFASGIGLWLSAINVKYRDIAYITPFFIQILLYLTPIIYPISVAPKFHSLLVLNPMTGIVEAHRSLLLGNIPIDIGSLTTSIIISILIFISGAFYFRSVEKYFSDII